MADAARVWTDAQLAEIEAYLAQIYRDAQAELTVKWDAYMRKGEARLADLYADYVSAPIGKKPEALKRYQDALQNYTLRNQWYKDMVTDTTYRLSHVNQIALDYVNGRTPSIYVRNFNQLDPDALLIKSNWTIRNEYTVRHLVRESLPTKEIDYDKDMAWNRKKINSSVLQGILQGESIPKISKRLLPIVGQNKAAAVRTARTMVTQAENRGRYDRYRDYSDAGLVTNKIWLATPDGRTRAWHLDMDGQEVPWDEPFIDGHGNELEYPGDEMAEPETVYNCRCSMKSHIVGAVDSDGKFHAMKDYKTGESLHEKQIREERERRAKEDDDE